jgi:hypothetical protein
MLTNEQRKVIADAINAIGWSPSTEEGIQHIGEVRRGLFAILNASAAPAEGREALAWRVEWERGGQTWVRTYTNERDAIDDGQAFSGTVTPLYLLATAPTMSEAAGVEWVLVKRERLDEIKRQARTEFVNSYMGRNLYDERSLMQNERIGEEALSNIRDELQMIEEDEKDRRRAEIDRAAAKGESDE